MEVKHIIEKYEYRYMMMDDRYMMMDDKSFY